MQMPYSMMHIFKETFPHVARFTYVTEMHRQLAGCRTCLDVGCGGGSPTRLLGFDFSVGMEAHPPSLELARKNKTHNEFVAARVQDIGRHFRTGQFDCVVALDLIEHLTKEEGLALIREMERIARKKILIFTPNGFLSQQSHDGDLQEHLSGWTAGEMHSLGFTVIGMHGHRWFRGEQHEHRLKPKQLSGVVSELSHYLFTRAHPENAAAILCIKKSSG